MRTVLALLLLASLVLPSAGALPTPGFFCDASEPVLGRVFPEAENTNDFVSYDEAVCGLTKLDSQFGDWIRIDLVAKSAGWPTLPSGHDTFDVFVVRVSNEASNFTGEKAKIVFQLSIHGNEKGGREGGLRVIEDFARDTGMAKEFPELRAQLDWAELLFVFPNPDGWIHEEAQYRHADACYFSLTCTPGETGVETQNFVRVNGHGKDVNRQWPTVGWQRETYKAMGESEAIGLVNYLMNESNIRYASDIHGMANPADGNVNLIECGFNPQRPPSPGDLDPTCFQHAVTDAKGHFVLTMLPAGQQSPSEMTQSTSLAELVKERLNSDPYFAEWRALPSLQGAWGGEFNDWGTVWDTIGYTDSGFTSDFYAQDQGLNAPGVDFELSYNHITFDNYYPGLAQRINSYHVQIVRDIVRAFMEQNALDIQTSVDVKGTRTAYLENPTVVTNANALTVEGWPKENAADDAFDAAHRVFRAAPNDYFVDLKPHLADGDKPAVFDGLPASAVTAERLAPYTRLIVAGSAGNGLTPASVSAIKAWVEAGGGLVLTDDSMTLLEALGVAGEGSVDVYHGYAGATNFVDKEHELVRDVRGLARETYEPVPLGFGIDSLNAPLWFVKADAFEGEVVGLAGKGQGSQPDASMVNFGRVPLGSGTVTFLGALLPDPTLEQGAPYGVDGYATTYTGNQLLRNALGWDLKFASAPLAPEEMGQARTDAGAGTSGATNEPTNAVPAAPLALALVAVGLIALARRKLR